MLASSFYLVPFSTREFSERAARYFRSFCFVDVAFFPRSNLSMKEMDRRTEDVYLVAVVVAVVSESWTLAVKRAKRPYAKCPSSNCPPAKCRPSAEYPPP